MQRFRKTFADEAGTRFAEPYPKLSSRRVLTMERFEGISLSDKSKLEHSGLDLNDIAKRSAKLFIEMIFRDGKKALRNRFSPKKILHRLRANAEDWEHLMTILPRDTADILRNLKRGKFDVHLQHRRLEPIVNRLVMGILTAALFMGSASLCSNQVRPTFFGFSVPGFLGCSIAFIMGIQISLAIRRSGTQDPH